MCGKFYRFLVCFFVIGQIIFVRDSLCADFVSFDKKKIALVKQVVYQDLYCASSDEPKADFIFSSFLRSGPLALFTRFNADFYIVEVEPEEECSIWKETTLQSTECKFKMSMLEEQRNRIPEGRNHSQGFYVVKCDDVDWSVYDIVIAINCAVPERITAKHPSVLWAYYVGEHTTPSHRKSFEKPIRGYDVFLTQDFFEKRLLKDHVVEFPYQLLYYGCFHELFNKDAKVQSQKGICLETWTLQSLSLHQKEKLASAVKAKQINNRGYAQLKKHVAALMGSKYFVICLGEKSKRSLLRGNCIPEAIAAGCLVIAQEENIFNKDLLSEITLAHSFKDLLDKIKFFECHPEAYLFERSLQQNKLDQLCFYRPIRQLFKKYDEKVDHDISFKS